MKKSSICKTLISAYQGSEFVVLSQPEFILRIGKTCQQADALLEQHNVQIGFIVTACNPYSNVLSDEDNQTRNTLLKQQMAASNCLLIDALGRDPTGEWPGEPSYFVMGINREDAIKWGVLFEQNAIVGYELGQPAELILLR